MKVPPILRIPPGAVLATSAVLLVSGCSHGLASPSGVAEDFGTALSSGDFAAACQLLTPAAVSELEDSSGEPCDRALQSVEVPAGGAVLHVEAWGRAAIAELEQDTLFLARTGESWAVRAAGCSRVENAPYDCAVTGG